MRRMHWFITIVLLFSIGLFSQEKRTTIGFDYGASFIQQNFYDENGEVFLALAPKNIRGVVTVPISQVTYLRLSAGFGMTSIKNEREASDDGFSSRFESEIKVSGLPLEGGLMFQVPVNNAGNILLRLGVMGGFYNYTIKQEGFSEFTSGNNTNREDFEDTDIKLSGIAQSFLFGLSVCLSESIQANLEFSKLGLSLLKIKEDVEVTEFNDQGVETGKRKIGESKQDFNAASGLNDLGISLGISVNLGG